LQIYTDASLNFLGIYIPATGWCQIIVAEIQGPGIPALHIAHLEMIAFILGHMFAILVSPLTQHIHIHVDNQNAQALASGNISTNNNIANQLVVLNALIQNAYGRIQTRSYIRSEENFNADAISRNRFRTSPSVPEYRTTPRLIAFFKALLTSPDSAASQIAASLPTTQECEDSSLFCRC
jgi:hypothetical protein